MKLPRQTTKKTRAILWLLLAILLLAALQPLVWRLAQTAAVAWHQRLSKNEHTQDIEARLAVIEQQYEEQNAILGQLDVVIPPKTAAPQVIERVEQLAEDYNLFLHIESIKELQDEIGFGLTTIVVQANTTGPPTRLLEYLNALEHLPEVTRIEKWVLAPLTGGAQPASGLYSLDFDLVFYLQEIQDERPI